MNANPKKRKRVCFVLSAFIVATIGVLPINSFAASIANRNLPPECTPPANKCGCQEKKVSAKCIKATVELGETTPWTGSLDCSLKIFADNTSPSIFTAESLYAVLGGYTFKRLGTLNLNDGITPAGVIMSHPNGEPVHFVFKEGESIARPDPGVHIKMDERLMMVDAQGWATTKEPVYYDLYPGDGSRRRFMATNMTGALGELVSITTPQGVTMTPADMGVDIVYDSNGVRQFITPSRLANITHTDGWTGYDVTVYALQSTPKKDAQTGLYAIPNAQPVEIFSVRRENDGKRAILTVQNSGGEKLRYVFDYGMGDWLLTRPTGAQEQRERYMSDEEAAKILTSYVSSKGERLERTEYNYKWESWGFAVTNKIEGFRGVTDTTSWTYYTSGNGKGQVKTERRQSGLLIEYAYDSADRVISEKRSGPDMMTEITTYDYAPVDPSDPALPVDTRPRTVVKTLNGIECERTYYVYAPLTNIVERVGTQGAAYGGTNVLRTVVAYYPVAANDLRSGRVKSRRHEDGKLDVYDYALNDGIWMEMVTHLHEQSPAPVSGKTTRDVTLTNARGEVTETRTEAFIENVWHTIARERKTYNVEGKRITSENLAGQVTTTAWDCCHKISEVQPDGSTTMWDYDEEGRMIASSRLIPLDMTNVTWLTTCYEYDDLGRQIATWQTNRSAKVGLPITRTCYDQLGRVVARVDQLGNTTTTSYSNDGRTVSVKNPNTSTRVSTRSADGDTLSITGSAVTPEFHSYGILPDGTRWSRIVQGETADSPRFTKRYENLLGQTILEERSGFKGAVLATVNAYDSLGRLVSSDSEGEPLREFTYDIFGNHVTSVMRVKSGEWRKNESRSSYELIDLDVWDVQTNITSCSDNSIAQISQSTAERISGLSSVLCSQTLSTDIRNNVIESRSEFYGSETVELSVLPAQTVSPESHSRFGVEVRTVSTTGIETQLRYDALGRRIGTIDGRGKTACIEYDSFGQKSASFDADNNRTSYGYDMFGQLVAVTNPLNEVVLYDYDLRGRKTYEGGATYPVRYEYDVFGNMVSMTTYRAESGSGDTTRWYYDEATGLTTRKVYADGKGPFYEYDSHGRLVKRTWARGIETAYSYNDWGSLTRTDYSDETPSVVLTYDVMGRQKQTVDAAGVTTFAYDVFGASTNETVVGVAGTNVVERFYDDFGRDIGYALNGIRQTTLSYDSATGRIATMLSAGSDTPFAWNYLAGTDFKASLVYPNGTTASWTYGNCEELLEVVNAAPTGTISKYSYAYDAAGRRVSCEMSGSVFTTSDDCAYFYNARNELTNATAAVDADYRYSYQFDDIGNRNVSIDRGTNSVYTVNSLNQYIAVDDFVPQFDDDGNQTLIKTSTGIWSVTYNGENRPVRWESGDAVITMSYDRMGRRVAKDERRFVYDGYLQVADSNGNVYIWDPTEPIATRPLVWNYGPSSAYYAHDGNKNVSEVVEENGNIAAHYEYAPFGAVTMQSGVSSAANPWRFSSEYAENDTMTVYYNYRHYEPVSGRWLRRDKIQELGGVALYVFCGNIPWHVDSKGLKCSITIYAGHSITIQGLLSDLAKNKIGPTECGDMIGIVSCFRDRMNAEVDRKFPGHIIPGIPRDPGPLHKDEVPDNPNNDELASKGLLRAWDAAMKAAQGLREKCCCTDVKISVLCDKDMKITTRWIEVRAMNYPAYKDHKDFNWCKRKGTYSTLWQVFTPGE